MSERATRCKLRPIARGLIADCSVVGKTLQAKTEFVSVGLFVSVSFEPCRVFHLLNALSCRSAAAVSSSHVNLMQECEESVAID